MKKLTNKKGFTLVELLVVMAILGILILLAAPRFSAVTQGAKRRTFEANHKTMISAVTMYMAETGGAYPKELTQITHFLEGGTMNGKPAGTTYGLTNWILTSEFSYNDGGTPVTEKLIYDIKNGTHSTT